MAIFDRSPHRLTHSFVWLAATLASAACSSDPKSDPATNTNPPFANSTGGTGAITGGAATSGGARAGSGATGATNNPVGAGAAGRGTNPTATSGAGATPAATSGTGGPITAGSFAAAAGNGTVTGGGGTGAPATAGSGTPTNPTPAGPRVDNPYVGVKGYVNPEWKAKASAEPGGERIADTPTAVWLDRIAAIAGTTNSQSNGAMGLKDHLDAALAQGAGYAQFVIYNLPGRDCAALASNGELKAEELPRYKAEYIDPIAAIMGDPKYSQLRIINVIEVDSLPNLVTNLSVANCQTMKSNGGYVQGVAYALQKLGSIPNVYNYVDAGHHGWLGWMTNLDPAAQLLAETVRMAGNDKVHGFITNSANYSALKEEFFEATTNVGGTSVRMSKWVDWNDYVDELSFAQAFRTKVIGLGLDANIGMLIDTSRNGWGGPQRPKAASAATDPNTFVNESRIDRRIHAGNWCNQSGAGLGERPTVAPAAGIDAYVWIKPPGESDGSSMMIQNNDGKGFDRMCDPTYGGNMLNGNSMTGSKADAPISGAWFSAQFQELMQNAHPPL